MLETAKDTKPKSKLPLMLGGAVAVLTLAFIAFLQFAPRPEAEEIPLTEEAEAYAANLNLANVQMTAALDYFSQRIVEIEGTIENAGDRPVQLVEIYCIFYDYSGVEILRSRVAIVNEKMGGLAPEEIKTFRLPFDQIPDTWNQQQPSIFIAGLEFADSGDSE